MEIEINQLKNKKIFISGGTGFIGSRLIEKLFDNNISDIRVLVSSFANASRIARFPVSMIQGDITKPEAVKEAMAGSDIVIHCAYGNKGDIEYKRKVDVEGTQNILEAARALNVERLIHLSTVMVYGDTDDRILTEEFPTQYSNQPYPDNKIDAEKLVYRYHKDFGLPVCVLQPTAVYGPFAPTWTVNILKRLKKKRVMLINNGEGYCNPVYIDDVIQAILRATISENAIGQSFLISSKSPVTWREFYSQYETMLGYKCTISVSESEALKISGRISKILEKLTKGFTYMYDIPPIRRRLTMAPQSGSVGQVLKILPGYKGFLKKNKFVTNNEPSNQLANRSIQPYTKERIRYFKSKRKVSISKAEKLLGYEPAYSFERGMEKTKIWAQWAHLIDT